MVEKDTVQVIEQEAQESSEAGEVMEENLQVIEQEAQESSDRGDLGEESVQVIEQEAKESSGDNSEYTPSIEYGEKSPNTNPGETAVISRKELSLPFDRQQRFNKYGISLEETQTTSEETSGIVKVRNIVYQKTVYARVTFDYWESWRDIHANHLKCLPAETADLFIFKINWHIDNSIMEFAVCCKQHGTEFWANNNRLNFLLIRPQVSEPNEMLEITTLETKVLPFIEEEQRIPLEVNAVIVGATPTRTTDEIQKVVDNKDVKLTKAPITPHPKTHLTNVIPTVVDAKAQLLKIASMSTTSRKTVLKMIDAVEDVVERTKNSKPENKKRKRKGIRAAFRKVLKFFKRKK